MAGDKKGWPLKWTPLENFHITLKFLGECERTDYIKKITEDVCSSFDAMTVHLHGMGAFPCEEKGPGYLGRSQTKKKSCKSAISVG